MLRQKLQNGHSLIDLLLSLFIFSFAISSITKLHHEATRQVIESWKYTEAWLQTYNISEWLLTHSTLSEAPINQWYQNNQSHFKNPGQVSTYNNNFIVEVIWQSIFQTTEHIKLEYSE